LECVSWSIRTAIIDKASGILVAICMLRLTDLEVEREEAASVDGSLRTSFTW